MPTLKIDITAVTDDGDGTGTGTYEKVSGPGTVQSNGDINIKGQADVEIAWTVTAAGFTFADPGYSGAKIVQFGAPSNSNGDTTCSITDINQDLGFKYSLFVKDGSGKTIELDPRVINR